MTDYNCPNCGAPITNWQCPYCGTVIHDFVNMDFEGHTPTWLRMKIGQKSVLLSAKPLGLKFELGEDDRSYLYADNTPYYIVKPSPVKISAEFEIVPDEGVLWKSHLKDEHK